MTDPHDGDPPPSAADERSAVDRRIAELRGAGLEPDRASLREVGGAALWFDAARREAVLAAPDDHALQRGPGAFGGETERRGDLRVVRAPANAATAAALRLALPNLTPRPLGLATAAGFGDRLGCATPGHVRALERVLGDHPEADIRPIFAQQSIREMTRTRRTAQQVLDDATLGAFEAGWRGPVGADADHLKTEADIERCAEAGYSFFTIDPGDRVDDAAASDDPATLAQKLAGLPWDDLEDTETDLLARYEGRAVEVEDLELAFEPEALRRAAAKYGAALAHTVRMSRHLDGLGVPFELEVSVDETGTPTTLVEHAFLVLELSRLGVEFVSLAPRFVGRFEKGIDFRGDLDALVESLQGHAAIARTLGPYKLSLHSGSDKFSVYAPIAEATRGMVHLKTAGTSYLEALRVVAAHDPELMREILELAHARFEEDRASYHISADPSRVPAAAEPADDDLPALLEDDDARQVLHVTFGSVLDRFGDRLQRRLDARPEAYAEGLERHFVRHLEPFAPHATTTPKGSDR